MAYLQVGDIRTFVVEHGEFVGIVYYSHKIYSYDAPAHAYQVISLDGTLRRVVVGRVKFKPANVSKEQERLLRAMASKRCRLEDIDRQLNKLKDERDLLYRDCDVISDKLAELFYKGNE